MTSKDTSIDLSIDDRTGKVPNESVIQKALIEQCINDIKSMINSTSGLEHSSVNKAPLLQSGENVYFVDGTRGAGKTTFMRSLTSEIKKDTKSRIYPLDLIDPTKFDAPMGILVSIISLLNSAIVKTRKDNFDWGKQNNDYDEWQDTLNNLAKGIKSYGKKVDSIDDVLRLSLGIDYTFSSLTLSQQCHDLFGKAAKIIGCKAFLLTFDDVDTNFSSGWEVLETIRCQLTSSRVVSLITGDIQLYTHLVRGKQFDNFSSSLFKYDNNRQNERELMVDHLEQQYLLKLFPVENRFRLKTLGQLINKDNQKIAIKNWVNNKTKEDQYLEVVMTELVADGLNLRISNKEYVAEYVNYIMQSPVRLNLQLISRYNNELRKNGKKLENGEIDTSNINKPQTLNAILNALLGSSLYKGEIDNIELSKLNLPFISNAVFNYSLLDGDLNTGFYLRPSSSEEYLRNISITLASAVAASLTGSISNSLRYMLVALGSVSLFDKRSKIEANNTTHHNDKQFKKLFADYMGIARDESLSNWASHVPACISEGGKADKGIYPGVLQFNRYPRPYYLKDITPHDYVVFNYQKENDLAYISAAAASSQTISKSTQDFFSVFSLIASIDELMNVDSSNFEGKHFVKVTSVPSVTVPNWSGDVLPDTTEDDEADDIDDGVNSITLSDTTRALFESWREYIITLNNTYTPSALLMGKIWTRLYFNLENINDHHVKRVAKSLADKTTKSKKDSNAAIVMRYNVIALLNATLFEEDKYHKHDDETSIFDGLGFLANPVSSGKEFSNKISMLGSMTIKELNNKYPMFMSLISCPLIIPFMFAKNGSYTTPQEKKYDQIISSFIMNITLAISPDFINLSPSSQESISSIKIKDLTSHVGSSIDKVKTEFGLKTLYKASIAGSTKGSKPKQVKKPTKSNTTEETKEEELPVNGDLLTSDDTSGT
jgi:hypothetical protein